MGFWPMLFIGILGALRHPVSTITAWLETWHADQHKSPNITVTVNKPTKEQASDIGREIIENIKQYQKRAGSAWRKTS